MSISKKKSSLKKKSQEENVNFRKELKDLGYGKRKRSFSEIESLIKLSRQTKNKPALNRWKKVYRQKELSWAEGLLKGQQKLQARQQDRREKKELAELKEQSHLQRKKRLKDIYSYFNKELLKKDKNEKLATGFFNLKKEFIHDKSYELLKLNKAGSNYLLKQTSKAYQEEVAEEKSKILWEQDKTGFTKLNTEKLSKKQKIKLFFPNKEENKEFWTKNKEFKKTLKEIVEGKRGSVKGRKKVAELTSELYRKSPLRLRDRLPALTKQPPPRGFGLGEIYDKFVKNNHNSYTRKHYQQAIIKLVSKSGREGELIPDHELDLDKYGKPRLKEGQVIVIDNQTPGRTWTVYKNVPSLEEKVKRDIHEIAQEGYIREYGTELEIQTWKQKKDKSLCWVEAVLGESCADNQGTSAWWCLECINYGPYHPPVLPKHCQWRYTYRENSCGTKEHSDANKQWHWSIQGERTRGPIKGGDWGSCHTATFAKPSREKPRRKKYAKR